MSDLLNAQISEFIAQNRLVADDDLKRAIAAAQKTGERLDRTLLALGFLTEDATSEVIARCFEIRPLTEDEAALRDPGLLSVFKSDYLRKRVFAPIRRTNDGMTLAFADPLDHELIRAVEYHIGEAVDVRIATPKQIEELLNGASAPQTAILSPEIETRDAEAVAARGKDGPAIRLVDRLMALAVDEGASDIHIEATPAGLTVRLRVHGLLKVAHDEREVEASTVFARIKALAKLNVSERRLPQDGRIRLAVRGKPIDFRVSLMPTEHGESAVLRVLDRSQLQLDITKLGFNQPTLEGILRILDRPHGLFLVTGPTGSGKTTTLYAALNYLNRPETKICTIEDPVEYSLEGINQTQVHAEIGLDFATSLRALLRQDPNVLMIGEIRDAETAAMACRAALVGRLVLSTLHVNSAEEAPLRLRDLGVENYLVDAVLVGVLAQELVMREGGRRVKGRMAMS